ncbi:hypothetical protein DFQ27_001676 [Actinomortierella ambigua]|uniref:Ndc10 domain-containing protein n=1 Tax=Actinomortierella ambigua TaxID=1343610 RepID=A0A9P6U8D2_9FUNG|nr:hypothetical protein DFQ27_001676 [Actinomortierella ambigua]
MLRDEDLWNALLGDILMPLVRNKPGGSQIVHAMAFVVNQGKTNKDGDIQYGVALRHIDVRRCSTGALAFYLLEQWRRGEAHPSNELQMEIFPFVRTALFNDGSVEPREWVRACKDVMEEKIHELNDDPPLRDLIAATRNEDSTNRLTQQQQFLLMLVRVRRVILQDAAEYLCRFDRLDHPMLLQPMFHSPAFKEFQEEVRVCLSTPEPLEIQPWPLEASQSNKKSAACVNLGREGQQYQNVVLKKVQEVEQEMEQYQQAIKQILEQESWRNR